MIKASMASADITPPQGLGLVGYPHYDRFNTGAHDPLLATCMYLSDGESEVALVTLDLLFFSKKHCSTARKKARELCGISEDHIMISAIHTHSGPLTSGSLDFESLQEHSVQPMDYINTVTDRIAEIIAQAKNSAYEAEVGFNVAICGAEKGVGGNRRMAGGPHDPLVSVIAVRDRERTIRGIYVNYTLHPTFIHEWSTVCTSDYVCYVREQLRDMEPQATVCFGQGASGNQSSRYYRQGESFSEAERVGRAIGKSAHEAIDSAEWSSSAPIRVISGSLALELRSFGTVEELEKKVEEDTARYKELYGRYGNSSDRNEYYLWQNANLKMLGSENQLGFTKLAEKGVKIELVTDEDPAEIQLISIGDLLIAGVPGEIFVEYGLYVKAMAGYRMVIFNELTNGCLPGYVYTPESLTTGGYETDTSTLSADFGRHLTDAVIDLAEKLKRRS
ncbi:MAG: hypothetical protein IJM79_07965 [Erysipelotrichaceae bacterium]|nr:hypothetical protein [Erysipelotrichaceae bacterium]